jgi:hypothetical protein
VLAVRGDVARRGVAEARLTDRHLQGEGLAERSDEAQ